MQVRSGDTNIWGILTLKEVYVVARLPIKGKYKITSSFGWRTHPITRRRKFHNGVDYSGRYDRRVVATEAGKVTRRYNSPTAGDRDWETVPLHIPP